MDPKSDVFSEWSVLPTLDAVETIRLLYLSTQYKMVIDFFQHRCVFESWRCDGQVDCKDGTDELNCTVILPRKVITAATVGSLVCGLLLVIAMGCTCKLYSLRTREYR